MSKYGAKRTTVCGITFDSRKEARRYLELLAAQRAGRIRDLQRQAVFELLPPQKDSSGKTLERAVEYVADFVYTTAAGEVMVEDVKGVRTREYIIKRKLMLWRHNVQIKEV